MPLHVSFPRRAALLATLAFAAGCNERSPSEPAALEAPPRFQAGPADHEVRPAEAAFAKLARDVPGAGGFFLDETGTVFVYLKDRGRSDAAREHVATLLEGTRGVRRSAGGKPMMVALGGRFDFFELNTARNRVSSPVLDLPGVVYVDLDEAANRVTVGVSEARARGRVEARLAELGVEREIVNIEAVDDITEPVVPGAPISSINPSFSSVNGLIRPVVGGTQLGTRVSDPDKFRKCTLGFVARLNDGTRAIITNSHCSPTIWGTDHAVFHQPSPGRYDESHRFGYEYRDKGGESCGFLSINVCRYADATAVRIDDAMPDQAGYIVRTRFYSEVFSTPGSFDIDPVNPRFRIVGEAGFPFPGQYSHKIGATTGWTRGLVDHTCTDTKQPSRSYSRLRCQYSTRAGVDGGDSGSPVFFDNLDGTVMIQGILFGRSDGRFWWSPIHGIERDLGALNLLAPSAGGGGGGYDPGLPPPSDCTVDPTLPC